MVRKFKVATLSAGNTQGQLSARISQRPALK
jgi:hypothetical protein